MPFYQMGPGVLYLNGVEVGAVSELNLDVDEHRRELSGPGGEVVDVQTSRTFTAYAIVPDAHVDRKSGETTIDFGKRKVVIRKRGEQ